MKIILREVQSVPNRFICFFPFLGADSNVCKEKNRVPSRDRFFVNVVYLTSDVINVL